MRRLDSSPASGRFVFDRTRHTAPQIADFLREQILSLLLKPGTVLSRPELQEQFGVSQTPVRDALLKLEEEGLVTVFPQHATLVSRVDLLQARQAHFMRRAVEADIARLLATERPDGLVEDLIKANDRVRIEAQAGDNAAFLLADRAFHRIMFDYADMMLTWNVIQSNIGHLDRLRRLNLANVGVDRIIRQHEALIDAIQAGEPDRAERALRDHLANTIALLERVSAEYPEFIER